jgi:hypothetical protein
MLKKKLPHGQVGLLLRQKKTFIVSGEAERKAVLNGAAFLGIKVTTRKCGYGKFKVFFL